MPYYGLEYGLAGDFRSWFSPVSPRETWWGLGPCWPLCLYQPPRPCGLRRVSGGKRRLQGLFPRSKSATTCWAAAVYRGPTPKTKKVFSLIPSPEPICSQLFCFTSSYAHSSQGRSFSISDFSTVAPHQIRRPAGASLYAPQSYATCSFSRSFTKVFT